MGEAQDDADAVAGAGQRPRPPAGVNRFPRQLLWFGIVIGSVVSGIAAVVAAVSISDLVGNHHGGSEPYIYVNAADEILAGLTVVRPCCSSPASPMLWRSAPVTAGDHSDGQRRRRPGCSGPAAAAY